ncbi:uncharacterized protein LOC120430749 [Culex pipiens pallens]|uniref:uncharacterized protein LOC120430749 n=1 Tax=Culex pipiens pallens TaxID=42434 RepID=UPI001953F055|nr:uncharacterized protein LOC120430749 [Culex pipiens pallens]
MASVQVVLVSVVLLLVDNGCAITVNSDTKKANPKGGNSDRTTQSLTFSSNGEDQLIFRDDSAFPAVGPSSIRRVGQASSVEFFESGWRPLYSFNSEEQLQLDQLPQESSAVVHQLNALAEPPTNRTTKYFRFSESDIMRHVPEPGANRIANSIKFKERSSEEYYDEENAQHNAGDEPSNLSGISPRMLKFEESDIMKFSANRTKPLKFEESVPNSQPAIAEDSERAANYEVYVIENLLMNMTNPARYTRNYTKEDTQPRIVQNADTPTSASAIVDQRNSSRFFRFEEADRPRFEKSPTSSFSFFESGREEFNFPKAETIVKPSEPIRGSFKFSELDSRPLASSASNTRYDDDRSRIESSSEPSRGSFKFSDHDSKPLPSSATQTRYGDDDTSRPFKFTNSATSSPSRPQSNDDQFYTVKATIQIDGWNNPAITPPTNLVPVTTRRPKKKKGKIYNQHGVDIRKQDGFNYQQPAQYDNYLQQQQIAQSQYQANLQIPPTPQSIPIDPYYQTPSNPATQPFDPNTYYIQNYLANYPYQQPVQNPQQTAEGSSLYPSQYSQPQPNPNIPTNLIPGAEQTDSPLSAQSIFGFLQSVFNFAPGTLGSYQTSPSAAGPNRYSDPQQAGVPGAPPGTGGSPITAVSSQLRKALDKIADNDELQCVPKLICMMSRRSSGQGFSTYVNRGLLSTVLSAVPDSSPWLKFSRAALLGYGIGANSCDIYYPKCPKDESEIIFYLNNHRGGFFRYFEDKDVNRG